MINRFKKVLFAGLLIASASYADSSRDEFYSNSLVGFEGGYANFDLRSVGTTTTTTEEKFSSGGMKIGAETKNIRMFLSFRDGFMDDKNYKYDYTYMYGAELQYMFNVASFMNFFIGASVGQISVRFDDAANVRRDFTTEYMGGDLGFNIHMGDSVDLELGGRLISISEADHLLGGTTYTFDDITMGYASLIFKYQMD